MSSEFLKFDASKDKVNGTDLKTDYNDIVLLKLYEDCKNNLLLDGQQWEQDANDLLLTLSWSDQLDLSVEWELSPEWKKLYNALVKYEEHGVSKIVRRIPEEFLKWFIDALLKLWANEDNFTALVVWVRWMWMLWFGFIIRWMSSDEFKNLVPYLHQNPTPLSEWPEKSASHTDWLDINLSNIEDLLTNISAKDLFETWDGKLFQFVHWAWSQISNNTVAIFKSKLMELYGKEWYDGSSLRNIINADGSKTFTTITTQWEEMEFYFGP